MTASAYLNIFAAILLAIVLWSLQIVVVSVGVAWILLLCIFLMGCGFAHLARRMGVHNCSLLEQLSDFTLDGAECRLESDRKFIYELVEHWYGSLDGFVDDVRGPLRQKLLQCSSQIPIAYMKVIILPCVACKAEFVLAMWKGGVPGEALIAYTASSVIGLGCFWFGFCAHSGLYLLNRLARPIWPGDVCDFLQSAAIAATVSVLISFGCILDSYAWRDGAMAAAWAGVLTLSITWFCWASRNGA